MNNLDIIPCGVTMGHRGHLMSLDDDGVRSEAS